MVQLRIIDINNFPTEIEILKANIVWFYAKIDILLIVVFLHFEIRVAASIPIEIRLPSNKQKLVFDSKAY